jgi:hypothetical protein
LSVSQRNKTWYQSSWSNIFPAYLASPFSRMLRQLRDWWNGRFRFTKRGGASFNSLAQKMWLESWGWDRRLMFILVVACCAFLATRLCPPLTLSLSRSLNVQIYFLSSNVTVLVKVEDAFHRRQGHELLCPTVVGIPCNLYLYSEVCRAYSCDRYSTSRAPCAICSKTTNQMPLINFTFFVISLIFSTISY